MTANLDRTEQAARHFAVMAAAPFASDDYTAARGQLQAMRLTADETMAAAVMARGWFDLARSIAAVVYGACPDCGHTADRTTPCLCPPRPRGDVADTLPL